MWNENQLTRQLGIQYPIIQAGMAGGPTTPELIAAVSNAGGLGNLGAGYMHPKEMNKIIDQTRTLTNKKFGVNLFVPEVNEEPGGSIDKSNHLLQPYRQALQLTEPSITKPAPDLFEKQIEVIVEKQIPVCSFTFGVPSEETISKLKKAGIITIGTATTVAEAIINQEKGIDMVVMQGSEAGGHRGTFSGSFGNAMIGTMALVPQAVDNVNIPVIAAGGITDGRGVLAALILGADAVQIGTAFVTAMESGAKKDHIDALLSSTEDQTTVTSVFSGKPARSIQNQFIKDMQPYEKELPGYPIQNALTKELRQEAANQNHPEWIHLWSGQNNRSLSRDSAGTIIKDLAAQVDTLLEQM